jgi:hypothetical protein
VSVTNNIITNNVAGWDGGGISLLDSFAVNIVNNTIAFNASTASAGPLFNTLGAPLDSTPPSSGQTCTANCGTTTHPQAAGVVAIQNSAILRANLPPTVTVTCPTGHPNCRSVSYPQLENNIIWDNSSYYIGVGPLAPGTQNQQNLVTLFNMGGSRPASQTSTGACVAASYWDIGVRGDTGPTNHTSGVTLAASDSVLTAGGSSVSGSGNSTGNPSLIHSYCDGSRTPPETPGLLAAGWQVPPGISDATVPNPIFNLTPAATVDEGNNWVNLNWGPLSLTNPTVVGGANGNYGGGLPLGNYAITTGSSAAARVTGSNFTDAPAYDFFNTPRKPGSSTDAGAVKLTSAGGGSQFTISASIVDFGLVPVHSPTTQDQDIQVINSGTAPLTFNGTGNATISCTGVTGCNAASFTIATSTVGTATVLSAGSGYTVNDVLTLTGGGGSGASATVSAVSGTGAITGLTLTNGGNGYTNGATVSLVDATGAGIGTGATARITVYNPNTCANATLGSGESCVINVVFNPTSTSQAVRVANLAVTIGTITQTVALSGHDSIATITVSPLTPALTTNPANATAKTGTITVTNTMNPNTNPDAGPYIPTVIRLTRVSGAPLADYVLGGTCAVGTAINAGGTLNPPVAGSSCTITITYTPAVGTVGAALNGTVHLTVTGYGTAATTPIINANFNAN